MTAAQLTGGRPASAIKARVSSVVADWNRTGIEVTLAVVIATEDESTLWYVRSIASAAARAGIRCRQVDLGPDATELEIGKHLTELSNDSDVHGIILQTPLPAGVTAARLAVGQPGLLTAEHLSPGAVVIDVGTNVIADGTLVGDVDHDSVAPLAAAVSPVPGGVGSVTTALLLLHTVEAARAARGD